MGSLFKAREWWSTTCGVSEEFDKGCMCTGNVDNAADGGQKVVVGSYSGMLRVFHPKKRDYNVEDLVIEQSLGTPILQVAVGRFNRSMEFALAVLQPRKLSVYSVSAGGVSGESAGEHRELSLLYEHGFERTASNFCFGPFGQDVPPTLNKPVMVDDICVQSMDGCLHFFKQEIASFHRFLPKFLLPGVLIYAPQQQAFITASSHMFVCCYKHQMLAASSEDKHSEVPGAEPTKGKKVQSTWEANIGEHVLDIKVARLHRSLAPSQNDILVLGEHTLFCLTDSGEIRSQKRLEYVPGCLCNFPQSVDRENVPADNLLVASAMPPKISVYSDEKLEWICGMPSVPVCMEVCEFGNLRGVITTLDEEGSLSLSYLGTDPPNSVVSTGDKAELNYEEMDVEHRKLLGVIREATSDMREEPKDRVMLRAEMPTRLDEGGDLSDWRNRTISAKLIVSYTGTDSVENLQIEVAASEPVVVDQDLFTIESLSGGNRTPLIIPIKVSMRNDVLPASMELPVLATYLTATGEPRTARWDIQLPLCLVCTIVPPVKNADFKVTVDTTQPPPQLTSIFEDVLAQSQIGSQTAATANVLTFQYYCGLDVTVLVSKSSNRYRLQSNSMHSVWLIMNVLSSRLIQYFQGAGGSEENGGFEIGFKDTLPLPEYFQVIEQHLMARHNDAAVAKQLADRSTQFRAVQKRLLLRFKDRNPASLAHLETLLAGTYQQLLALSKQLEQTQAELRLASNVLACSTRLITNLIRFQYNLDPESYEVLCSYLSADVSDTPDQGWEETTDAALTSMLRSALSKKEMVNNIVQLEEALNLPQDAEKLKKHIAIMCERLGKSDVGRLALLKQKDQAPPAEPAAGGGGGAPPGAETPA